MTMPHLMNCQHSDTGWCLDCVKELWDEKDRLRESLVRLLSYTERCEVDLDSVYGCHRTLKQMEERGILDESIVAARCVLKEESSDDEVPAEE